MTKILIIDDETFAVANLLGKIEGLRPASIIKTTTSPIQALSLISEWKPDIVFLDITMPGLNGFELLDQLPNESKNFSLIFCTAHDEFALEAFESAAIDYIVKPVSTERLETALKKGEVFSEKLWNEKLRETLQQYQHKIVGKNQDQKYIFLVEDINFFTSEHHETIFRHDNKEYFCDLSLSELESKLDPQKFFRSHRSFLINLSRVQSFSESESFVRFGDPTQFAKVSKRMKMAFKAKLQL